MAKELAITKLLGSPLELQVIGDIGGFLELDEPDHKRGIGRGGGGAAEADVVWPARDVLLDLEAGDAGGDDQETEDPARRPPPPGEVGRGRHQLAQAAEAAL